MMNRLLPVFALISFAAVPFTLGSAEDKVAAEDKKEVAVERLSPAASVAASECLASEEVIRDLEIREKKIKEKEEALAEKEKDISAQLAAVKEEFAKLESRQKEVRNEKAKELANNEEKVSKLIEALETMSPKAAAGILSGVDDDLAVMALFRLSGTKTGKILSNMKNDRSSRLSELMAYGKLNSGKEKVSNESVERTPASKQ